MRTCGKNLRHERATPALAKGANPDGSRSPWEAPISSLMVALGGNPDLADAPGGCVCRDVLRAILTPETASFTFGGSCSGERSEPAAAAAPPARARGLRSPGARGSRKGPRWPLASGL